MADVWAELGKVVGRALKPLADMAAAIWTSFGDAAGDLIKGFMSGAQDVKAAIEPTVAGLLPDVFDEAASALGEHSPDPKTKEAVDKFIAELMKMIETKAKTEGKSLPTAAQLATTQGSLVAGIIGMYAATHAISIALDATQPLKDWGFKTAIMDMLYQFKMSDVIGPMIQAPIWSSTVVPLRMRANANYPYAVPGTAILPYLKAKDLLTDEEYKLNMSYSAFDGTWSDRMLENTWRYPSFGELRTMVHRGVATVEDLRGALKKSLVHADFLDGYDQLIPSIPSVSDLIRFAVREAYPDAVTFEEHYAVMSGWMAKTGFSQYFADAAWTAHWLIPTVGQADEMLHRGMIDEEAHRALYILNDIRPQDIDNLRALTWKLPGRIESRWMFRWGEVDVTDLRDALVMDGLDPAYADQVATAVAKNQFLSDINRQIANSKASFVKGYTLEATLRGDLEALGIRSEMVEYHVVDALADRERGIHDDELSTLRAQYARGAMTMADIITAVTTIIVDPVARDAWLAALPTAKQVVIMEETFGTEINRLVVNAKYDYVRGYITKADMVSRFTLLDLPDGVIEFHVMDADEDRERKRNDERLIVIKDMWMKDVETDFDVIEGWVDPIVVDVDARELWLADTYFDKLKAPLRPPTPPTLPTVTLATITRAFREGIISEADLRGELTRRGYSAVDIEIMVAVELARMGA